MRGERLSAGPTERTGQRGFWTPCAAGRARRAACTGHACTGHACTGHACAGHACAGHACTGAWHSTGASGRTGAWWSTGFYTGTSPEYTNFQWGPTRFSGVDATLV